MALTSLPGAAAGVVTPVSTTLSDDAVEMSPLQVRALLNLIATSTSDVVVVLNQHHRCEWVSPSIQYVTDWSPGEIVGRHYADVSGEVDFDEALDPSNLPDHSLRPAHLVRRDGTAVETLARVHPFPLGDGSDGYVAVLHSVVRDSSLLEQLSHFEDLFHSTVQSLNPNILIVDARDNVEWCSPHLATLLGYSPDYFFSRPLTSLTAASDQSPGPSQFHLALVARGGAVHHFASTEHVVRGHSGAEVSRILSLVLIDDTSLSDADDAASTSLTHYSTDVIVKCSPDLRILTISSSVERLWGWRVATLLGRPLSTLLCAGDDERLRAWKALADSGTVVGDIEFRVVMSNNLQRWVTASLSHHYESNVYFITLAPAENIVRARHAWRTIIGGQRAIAESTDEDRLLRAMCRVAVDSGGYAFSWYAKRVDDDDQTVEMLGATSENEGYLDALDISWSNRPSGMGPTGRCIVTGEAQALGNLAAESTFTSWRQRASDYGFRSSVAVPIRVRGRVEGAWTIYSGECNAFTGEALETLTLLAEDLGRGIERLRDNADNQEYRREQRLLSNALAQTSEMVIITDVDGRIRYINDAVVNTTGYLAEELIGNFPRLLQSGTQDREFYVALWQTLLRGQMWRGNFVNRKKDGSHYEVEASLSPIYDTDGVVTGYLGLSHEITLVRQLETMIDMSRLDHSSLAALMSDVRAEATLEQTAHALCQSVLRINGVGESWFMVFDHDDGVVPVGTSRSDLALSIFDEEDMKIHTSVLRRRSQEGPWWRLTQEDDDELHLGVNQEISARGVVAFIHLPVRYLDDVIGILVLGTHEANAGQWLEARKDAFNELGAFASSLLGSQAQQYRDSAATRQSLDAVLTQEAWTPVFQAFTNLITGETVGYEALTRFDDAMRPDLRFLAAFEVGRGIELEAACAASALRAAEALPKEHWLSLNFAPQTILSGAAKEVLKSTTRHVVIEITEHAVIEDYEALHQALREIPNCHIAVDDAGSGYTSFSHIVQLRPDYVKMDISLIRDIDQDPVRQAMVAGLCHFAVTSDCVIIAEGIERSEEADVLRALGVTLGQDNLLGQGYLFGRPGVVSADGLLTEYQRPTVGPS